MRVIHSTIVALCFGAGTMILAPASAQTLPPATQAQVTQTINLAKAGCAREIKAYCSRVKEGEGRLAACLYAHSDRMSDRCADAIIKRVGELNAIFAALTNAIAVCEPDTSRLCNGVAAGNGNLLGCLTKARPSVSAECNAAISAAAL